MQLVAAVTSSPHPQAGQSHRSSGNFSYQNLPPGTTSLLWEIDQSNPEWQSISFDVMQDVSGGSDPVIFNSLMSGNRTDLDGSGRSLYIANPAHATESFTVQVYALTN
ncbi:DeoR family transcriptional regulator [Tumebacillus sp. ITR2]|uniref:DeoR family transcriptional regulator n=2 Tax=Tumebacillus amylolyticus TaxID=2801339 RepID=A0ABS1J4D2_9BACL|nr:DeoR family transcriptional regulator [Tumebacillus amylolyticus]MBL0385134.1 DeoR family transcriptional regulator [Tumebacillus amylolyticus]